MQDQVSNTVVKCFLSITALYCLSTESKHRQHVRHARPSTLWTRLLFATADTDNFQLNRSNIQWRSTMVYVYLYLLTTLLAILNIHLN